jgi:hypothetical protein
MPPPNSPELRLFSLIPVGGLERRNSNQGERQRFRSCGENYRNQELFYITAGFVRIRNGLSSKEFFFFSFLRLIRSQSGRIWPFVKRAFPALRPAV